MINKIIHFSIKHKALIWLMVIALIIGGIYAMKRIPIDAVPDITNNQVLVITTAPNLGTEDIEKFVTYQVELAVANLPNVEEIRSVSRFGLSVVTIVFSDDAGTFLPRQLVNEALNEVKEKIPEGFGSPFMAPISTGLGEIYQYTLEVQPGYENKYDDMQLRTIQDWIVKRQMAMVPGVVEVNSFGGRVKQYEVAINPDKLQSMHVSMSEVFEALKKNNQNTGGAYIEKNHRANFIRGEGLMRSLDDIKNTFVKNINGTPIYVRDIAEVKFGNFVRYGAFTKDGKGEAVGGIVMMLKGANSNDVIKRVKKRVALIEKSLPEGIKIKPFLDRSKLIKSTTSTVAENLALGALIVIFILIIFLGNFRGGLIVASTIPLALLFAFIMMHIFGVWANLMSMGALDFGILIDGAVIIIESMIFYLYRKNLIGKKISQEKRDELAYTSASKMMNAAFFGQLIILIVFIPILSLQGIEGKMFIPMALTFSFAIIGVMLLSLTYVPMAAATFLKPPKTSKISFGSRIINSIEEAYKHFMDKILKHSKAVIASAIVLLIFGGYLFSKMGAEFIPKLDEGDLAFQIFLKPGTSLSDTEKISLKAQKIILENFPDEVESVQSRIGVATLPMDPMPMDIADTFVILKPKSEWKYDSKEALVEAMEDALKAIPGIGFEFTQPIEMRFNELLTGVREDIAIKLYGDDLNILADKAKEIANLISNIKGISGLKTEATKGLPQITIKYNRTKLGQYDLNINDLNKLVETAFSGAVTGNIYEGERMFDLAIRLDEKHRKNINDIKNLYITLSNGNQIPLKEVAEVSYQPGPMQISRDNTNRRTYIGVNVDKRDIKSIVNDIKKILDQKLTLPSGYYIRYGGAFENLERATNRLIFVVPIALILIFLLVYFATGSFKQTLMIYMAIPFAAVGGIFLLYLRGMPFSISAGVGFIVLFGVAVLNGLVLISGFNELKATGKYSLDEIVKLGAVRRIRPILLTASTDILGFLPMALSTSAGAEVQRPLATVVIGGMITSTILTLIVLPILYKWVESQKPVIKLKPAGSILTVIMILGFSFSSYAQKPTIDLDNAINLAKKNYPGMKAAKFKVSKQIGLKMSAFDLGTTEIFTGNEELINNVPGVKNNWGIAQNDMDILNIPIKLKQAKKRIELAEISRNVYEKSLVKKVRLAWHKALYYKKLLKLYKDLDTLYQNFEKAAALKFETGESSKMAFIAASSKYKQLQVEIRTTENQYQLSLRNLNQYILLSDEFEITDHKNEDFYLVNLQPDLSDSPLIQYFNKQTILAKINWKVAQGALLPKLNLEYKSQTIEGITGYKAWQIGVSLPFLAFNKHAKNKAAKYDYQTAEQTLIEKNIQIKNAYSQNYQSYKTMLNLIEFYKKEALPLAEQQIIAAETGYKLGQMSYTQFIQNVENALMVKKDYLKEEQKLYEIITEIKYLTEKN